MELKLIRFSAGQIEQLKRRFENLDEVEPFTTDVKLASQISSYGIFREVGTVNDELARFIFNVETAKPVSVESLKAELIEWKGLFGVRIYSTDSNRLELRTEGFYNVVHPVLSKNADGTLHSLVIFPEIIQKIAKAEGVDLVLVKSWGMNSIFGGFDPAKGYYQTNFWEIENNDALKFADLIRRGKVAFMGTHDLVAHIAGIRSEAWPLLQAQAEKVFAAIDTYFKSAQKPSLSALILPYTIGVVLDDLAQPPSYGSNSHAVVLDELLLKLSKNEIPAGMPTLLTQFPESFQKIIEISRTKGIEQQPTKIKNAIQSMVQEILRASFLKPA